MDGGQAEQLDVGWREGQTGTPYFLSALRRQFFLLISIPVLVSGLALAYAVTVEPLYTATAEISVRVNPEEITPQISPLSTHIELIQSESVTSEVIERVGLEPSQEAYPSRLRQVITTIRGWLGLSAVDGIAEFDPESALIRGVASGILVERVEDSSLIMIQYTSPLADLSAELANAYARTYVDQKSEQTDRSIERRRERLEQRAEDVRQLALGANQTSQELLAGNGFAVVSADELGRRIADFRERLSAVNAEEATLKARLERIPSVETGDALEQAALLSDETTRIYSDLRDASDILERLRAQSSAPEGTMAQLEENVANLRSDLAQALNRHREELRAELAVVAARRENILAEREQVIAYGQSDAWAELVNTERKASTYEAIYQSYVQDLEDLNREDPSVPVSFVSAARPPTVPSFPNYKVVLAFGVTIGIVLGGALALLREWRRQQPF